MAEANPVEVIEDKTSPVAPAPGTEEGQAGGSPPQGETPTSGGTETETEKALRRRLTEQAEEIKRGKDAQEILDAAARTPGWKAVVDSLSGKPESTEPDLDVEIFGNENPNAQPLVKKWKAQMREEIRKEILRELTPVIREVGSSVQDKEMVRALKAENLAPSEAFETFREDFEAENPSYGKLRSVDAKAAAKWVASSFALKLKRDGRTPVSEADNGTLDRGGGPSGKSGAGSSLVKIDRKDPDKLNKMFKAFANGETPVDETGRPYPVPGQKRS